MYKPGEWKAVCDLCGLDYLASELHEDYLGRRVCRKDLETRHPQEFVRPRIEKITPEWTRPAEKIRQEADITSVTTISDWSDYPNFIVYLAAPSGGFPVNVGDANDDALKYASRVQIVRLSTDTSGNNISVAIDGVGVFTIEPGQGFILIPRRENNTWEFFGRVG